MRSRDPSTGLLVQAGGQTVVEYLTAKNSLIQVDLSCAQFVKQLLNTQAARGDEIVKPPAIEVQFCLGNSKMSSCAPSSGGHGKWAVGGKGEASAYLGEGGSHPGKVSLSVHQLRSIHPGKVHSLQPSFIIVSKGIAYLRDCGSPAIGGHLCQIP